MYVYVLKSLSFGNQYYVGKSKDLQSRIIEHNRGQSSYTKKYRPWEIINYLWFKDKGKAFLFERYLKTCSGREFMKKHFK
jgi:putative endonuclease